MGLLDPADVRVVCAPAQIIADLVVRGERDPGKPEPLCRPRRVIRAVGVR
jgi:hypothetical protein